MSFGDCPGIFADCGVPLGGEKKLHILRVRCKDPEEFQEHYQADQPGGGIFCPTTTELEVGAPVIVEIVCKRLPNRVMIRGSVVSWRPSLPRLRVRAGALVRFDADEATKRDFVLETLGGKRGPVPRRKHMRIPVGLPATFRLESEQAGHCAHLREISVSGALVTCPLQPAIGTDVVVELLPPGSATAISLAGRVLYHASADQTGVKFLFRDGGGSRRLRELVRRFKAS